MEVASAIKFGATIPFILSGGRAKDDLRMVQRHRQQRVDTGHRDDSCQYLRILVCGEVGKPGRGASLLHGGEFMAPMYGLTVDQQGSLFVVDNGNNRIQKFDNVGNFIILWETSVRRTPTFIIPPARPATGRATSGSWIRIIIACRSSTASWAGT